ncbi:uncharacterized protein [Amphiura filiformis]|uniref:uncharacterized protein n=1 Tax=Amphiura filiformis TaxID=82378 RepID=UPI003B21AD50
MEAIVEHIVNLPVEDILHMDMDLEQKIAREFLECQICMDRCKNPKDLDCRHFFCEECLVQLVAKDKSTSIKCPTCRKVTLIPDEGGISELPSNFYVSSLADVVKQRLTISPSTTTTTSTKYGGESPKESVLKKLATSASETSSSSSSSSSPSSPSSASPSPPPSPPSSPPMKTCVKHTGKELGMVCMTCTEEICYVCMMETHPQPEHKCKLYQKAIEESKQSLGKFQEQLRGSVARGQRYLDAIEENRSILNDNATQVLQAIQTATGETIRAIYSRSDELIKDVRNIQKEIDSELTNLTDHSTVRLEDDMKKLDTIDNVLEKSDCIDVISCTVAMKESDPGCAKLYKAVPHGVNFVQFVQQELGQEGGLGTLQPLDIVILGRDGLFHDEGQDKSGDAEKNKRNICNRDKMEGNLSTITVDGVTYHEINGRSGPLLISEPQANQSHGGVPAPRQDYPHDHYGMPMTTAVVPGAIVATPYSPQSPQPQGVPMNSTSPPYMGPQQRPSFPAGPHQMSPPSPNVYIRHVHPHPSPMAPPMQGSYTRPVLPHQRMRYSVPAAAYAYVPRGPGPYISNMPHREPVIYGPTSPVNMARPYLRIRQPCPGVTSPQPYPHYPADNIPMRSPSPHPIFSGSQPGGVYPQINGKHIDFYAGPPLMPVARHPMPNFVGANGPESTTSPVPIPSPTNSEDSSIDQSPHSSPSRSRTKSSGSKSPNSVSSNNNNNNNNNNSEKSTSPMEQENGLEANGSD